MLIDKLSISTYWQELKDVFGFDLIEVDKKSKTYLLVSELDADARALHYRNERDLEKMALIMPILGKISK